MKTVKQEDYDNCERENNNLRNALAWTASRLDPKYLDELEVLLDEDLENGGVTGTSFEDERQSVVEILIMIIKHVEPLLLDPQPPRTKQSQWFARLDYLLTEARQYESKHPLMRRIDGNPNVFAPVRKNEI